MSYLLSIPLIDRKINNTVGPTAVIIGGQQAVYME